MEHLAKTSMPWGCPERSVRIVQLLGLQGHTKYPDMERERTLAFSLPIL